MRSLSSTLLAAQKGYGVTGGVNDAIWKIVLSRSGQTTRGYDINRVMQIEHTEEEDNGIAQVLLDNSDLALGTITAGVFTGFDFEQYQGIISTGYNTGVTRSAWAASTAYTAYVKGVSFASVVIPTTANGYQYRCITAGTSHSSEPTWPTDLGVIVTETGGVVWEMDGNAGDEYSPSAPLKVDGQEFISSMTQLVCRLYLTGIPNQMRQDYAIAKYEVDDTDTSTIKTLLDAVAAASTGLSSAYNGYTTVTLTYDSGYDDGIINSYTPKDYFSIQINNNRDAKIQELMNYTGCKRRAEDDGAIHIFDPTTTGTTYDYEYRLDVSTYHTFFSKALRNRFVSPNKEIVISHEDHETQYGSSATSATSYALSPKIHTTQRRLTTNEQALAIAQAIIERYELNAERGSAVVPMNCGQEVFDYIKVTDSSQGDTRVGNIQYIQRRCRIATDRSDGAYEMTIRFGKVNTQSISYAEFGGGIEGVDWIDGGGGGGGGGSSRLGMTADQIEWVNHLLDYVLQNAADINLLWSYIEQGVVPKWHMTEQTIIPTIQ